VLKCWAKTIFFLSKPTCFDFSFNFVLQGLILSSGAALRKHCSLAYSVGKPTNILGEGKLV
jgi:hypothetical protein